MKLKEIRKRLVSYGYHPDEVEYAIAEVLQYKSPQSLKKIDFNILRNMLQQKSEIPRAKRI
ncbi:MAG TPA: hypothetical protein DCZ10_07555 [Pelotomaculum sp.]|nr:hypothetical protein [Pelotomaculum sp.]